MTSSGGACGLEVEDLHPLFFVLVTKRNLIETAWLCCLWMAAGVVGQAQRLSLHEAIEEALASPQAQVAAAQTDELRGLKHQASLGLNPRLFLQSEDWRPWSDHFDFPTQTEDYAFLSQTFETDGKRRKRVDLAEARLREAQSREQAARFAIAARVAAVYWNVVVSERIAVLLGKDMQAVDEMVRYHKERVDAGATRGVDLLRMQIERDRLSVALLTAQREAVSARLELFKQIGRTPTDKPELTDTIDSLVSLQTSPVAEVLERRIDLQQAREAVVTAEADVRLQRASGMPNLDLIGGFKRNSADNTGYGALQFDLPFRNRNQGEIERAEASLRVAHSNLQAIELQARAEIAQSEEAYQEQRKIIETVLPDIRANALKNLDLLTAAYRIGGVDLLRYLDAERTEFDVEVSALRIYAEYQQAALRLKLSYGVAP